MLKGEIDKEVSNLVNMTYGWARANHPLALRILQMTEKMTEEQLAKIPKSHNFLLKVLKDSANTTIPLDIKKYMDAHSNETILELLAENANMTKGELMSQAKDMAKTLISVPAVKEQVLTAMTTKIDGMPFGFTMLNLVKHLGNDVHVADLEDPVFVAELFKNVTLDVQPFFEIQMNKTLPALKEKYDKFGKLIKDEYEAIYQINEYARNLSYQYGDYFKRNLIHYIERKYNN